MNSARRAPFPWAVGASVLTVAVLFAASARATEVAAGTYGTETWTAAGSPYVVEGDATFADLTIGAGTTVLFSSTNTAANRRITLQVTTFTVNGTPASPVVFQAETDTTSTSAYQGIWIQGPSTITGAVMRNAVDGFDFIGGPGRISQSTFDTDSYAIIHDGGDLNVDGITAVNVGSGIWIPHLGTTTTVLNSVLSHINDDGIAVQAGTVTVINCTLDHTGGIVYSVQGAGSVDVRNSILSNGGGISFMASVTGQTGRMTVTNTDLWPNGFDFTGFSPGLGIISADPLYVSATDFHLRAGSPCIDVGEVDEAPDHDRDLSHRPLGATFDLGAYEYDPNGGAGTGGGGGAGTGGGGGAATGGSGAGGGAATGGSGGGGGTATGGSGAGGGTTTGGSGGNGGTATGGSGGNGGTATATGGSGAGGSSGIGGGRGGGGGAAGSSGNVGDSGSGGAGTGGGSGGGDGGHGTIDGGGSGGTGLTGGMGGSAVMGRGGSGGGAPSSAGTNHGCGCMAAQPEGDAWSSLLLVGTAVLIARRRNRRRGRSLSA